MYPYQNNYQNQLTQMLTQGLNQAPISMSEVHTPKVSGRPGAEAFQMAANSDCLLLDNTAPIVWLVQTDGAGYKTLTPYDIVPHKETKPEDVYKTLEDRIAKLEEVVNGKSNTTNATKRKSAESAE